MSLNLRARKQVKIGNFKGVDFSSSPLLVAQNRAVSSSNFIFENGVNRKRHGWVEKFRVSKGNINGIFEATLAGEKIIIVYAETNFYKVTQDEEGQYIIENITNTSTNENCKVDVSRLKDKRCFMFTNNRRLYFVGCGDYLTYGEYNGSYELRRVEDDDNTYIPTTTININANSPETDIVESFEGVNLLTRKRKNTFVGSSANSTFLVDAGAIDDNTVVKIKHEYILDGSLQESEYTSEGSVIYNGEQEVGSIDFEKGLITMTIDTTPPLEEESNLTITFEAKVDGYSDIINNMEVGIKFGANGNSDRLLLSGNPENNNIVYYSEAEDLTYFGDLNWASVGSTDAGVVGFSRLGDATLAIHKEELNGEASVYFMTGTLKSEEDANGNIDKTEIYFNVSAGTIGEGMVSKYANANLSGDKLFLSKNGVYGIILSSNVASTERYSKERSQYIREKLKTHKDLSKAVGIAFDNKYYLALDDVCYIADATMTSQNTSDTNSFNYEWYFWENMPVRVWGVINNSLFFGTVDGRVCTFDNQYVDRIFEYSATGDLMVEYENNKVVFNSDLTIKENDIISFNTDIFKVKLKPEQIIKVQNNRIYVSETDIMDIFNKTKVYADQVHNSGLKTDTLYLIDDVDLSGCSFKLTENDVEVEISSVGFRLCENIKLEELCITHVESDMFQLKRTKQDLQVIELAKYNDSVDYQTPLATFVIKQNVSCIWYSPLFDLGTNQDMKTLLALTISTEPTASGQVDFGYMSKNTLDFLELSFLELRGIQAQGVHVFDFESLDFNNFTFDSSFANSYTVSIKDYFNFIQFFFKSDNDKSCVIHSITMTYKIGSINKGVQ